MLDNKWMKTSIMTSNGDPPEAAAVATNNFDFRQESIDPQEIVGIVFKLNK